MRTATHIDCTARLSCSLTTGYKIYNIFFPCKIVLIEIENVSNCLGRLFHNYTQTLNQRTETPGGGLPPKMDYFA